MARPFIAPGEDHEFLPASDIGSMDDLAAKHPTIALGGTIRDAFDQTHVVDERIDVAEFWARTEGARERWEESPEQKVVRELEKIRKEIGAIQRPLARVAALEEGRRLLGREASSLPPRS